MRDEKCTLICPANGLGPAFELLMDLCPGASVYYAGNMDYRGLAHADKLAQRYGKNIIPWRYGRADYELVISHGDYLLPDEKKNLAMHNDEFAALLSLMRKTGKTAPALPLVPLFAEDIRALLFTQA
jgi:hypothetical protein